MAAVTVLDQFTGRSINKVHNTLKTQQYFEGQMERNQNQQCRYKQSTVTRDLVFFLLFV